MLLLVPLFESPDSTDRCPFKDINYLNEYPGLGGVERVAHRNPNKKNERRTAKKRIS